MGDQDSPGDGRFASTRQNRTAGRALRAARLASGPDGSTQAEFAALLVSGLGVDISAAALSNWESGRRSVPTAVLIEAGVVSGRSIDALLARAAEPVAGDLPPPSGSDVDLAQAVAQQRRELSEMGQLLARMRRRLEEEGILLNEPSEDAAQRQADAM